MAHGYWVVFADVTDPEGYKEYIAANGKALAKFGARFLARGGKVEPKEGQAEVPRDRRRISGLCRRLGMLPFARIRLSNEAPRGQIVVGHGHHRRI